MAGISGKEGLGVNTAKTEVLTISVGAIEKRQIQGNEQTWREVRSSHVIQVPMICDIGRDRLWKDYHGKSLAVWQTWMETSGVVCDRKLPSCEIIKMYSTWTLRRKEETILMRNEMTMIRRPLNISLRGYKTKRNCNS